MKKLSDVPLHCVLSVINYCLEHIDSSIYDKQKGTLSDDIENNERAVISTSNSDIKSDEKNNFNKLLFSALSTSVVPDSKSLLLIRTELSLESVIILINHLIEFLTEFPCDMHLIEWATLILDSYYQSFLINKDGNMIKTLRKLCHCVDNQVRL